MLNICDEIKLRCKIYIKRGLYELPPFHNRRIKLPRNCKTFGQERKFHIKEATAKLYFFQGRSEVLPVYGTKEKLSSEQLRRRGTSRNQAASDKKIKFGATLSMRDAEI